MRAEFLTPENVKNFCPIKLETLRLPKKKEDKTHTVRQIRGGHLK
jgi:hypothetical protein